MALSGKHKATLAAVFADPVRANIAWRDVEALFLACGAEVSEGNGSRVRVALEGVRAVFHRRIRRRKQIGAPSDRSGVSCRKQESSHEPDEP